MGLYSFLSQLNFCWKRLNIIIIINKGRCKIEFLHREKNYIIAANIQILFFTVNRKKLKSNKMIDHYVMKMMMSWWKFQEDPYLVLEKNWLSMIYISQNLPKGDV